MNTILLCEWGSRLSGELIVIMSSLLCCCVYIERDMRERVCVCVCVGDVPHSDREALSSSKVDSWHQLHPSTVVTWSMCMDSSMRTT